VTWRGRGRATLQRCQPSRNLHRSHRSRRQRAYRLGGRSFAWSWTGPTSWSNLFPGR